MEGPFCIETEFKKYMGVDSCSQLSCNELEKILADYTEWKKGYYKEGN